MSHGVGRAAGALVACLATCAVLPGFSEALAAPAAPATTRAAAAGAALQDTAAGENASGDERPSPSDVLPGAPSSESPSTDSPPTESLPSGAESPGKVAGTKVDGKNAAAKNAAAKNVAGAPQQGDAAHAHGTFDRYDALIASLTIFVLAVFVGFEVIAKVPPTLHTPLMSGSNAISGITIVGAILVAGYAISVSSFIGMLAVALAMINVVGGFLVTHRMLLMFRKK